MSTFAELGVPGDLVAVLERQRIVTPFPIQEATIPDGMYGRDVLGRAPTGSGKTLAFGIPMVAKLGAAEPQHPRALILSPTRELADQIRRELEPLAHVRDRNILALYGGTSIGPQINALKDGADLVVATPGRLMDLLDKRCIFLDAVRYLVVDEADRMADMGFLPDVIDILDQAVARKQTVLFSATLGKEVKILTDRYQQDPVTHEVGATEPDLSMVEHRFVRTTRQNKIPVAAEFIRQAEAVIVFCRTKHGVDRVAKQLKAERIRTGLIHGDRSQNQRESALHLFSRGKIDVLVATDVAARGIHVDGVDCVIHFDPPEDDKAYVHRSGRTARAGASGQVVSFINNDQERDMWRMQQKVGIEVELEDAPEIAVDLARDRARAEELGNSLADRKRSGTGERPYKPKKKPAAPNTTRGKGDKPQSKRSSGKPSKRRSSSAGPKTGAKPSGRRSKNPPRESGGRSTGGRKSGGGRNSSGRRSR
jgi:superfamily II DNA/RNA helicase